MDRVPGSVRVFSSSALLIMVTWACVAHAQPRLARDQVIPPAELEAFIDGVMEQAMDAEHIAGAAVSVVQSGRVVFKKGYGFADLASQRRVDPDTTLFRIGSITKTFTWIALMTAVEAGRVSLDDPVNAHLPPSLQLPDEQFAQPIRIRHLMTHSPGLEDRILTGLFENDAANVRPLSVYLREERPRRVGEPGRVHAYSNYGVGLAGAVLEQIHGRPWQEVIEGHILEPLGMTYTSPREPYPRRSELPPPMPEHLALLLSRGYRWRGFAHEPQRFEYISQIAPAGAMSSTAGDFARYMLMLLGDGTLDGTRIFGDVSAKAFRTPMSALPADVGNWNGGFLELRLPGGFRSIGHDGGSLLFFSSMVLAPELRLGIFITTNTEHGDRLSGVLPARIVEHFYASPGRTLRPGAPDLTKAADVFDGYYLQTRRPHGGLQGYLFRLMARRVRVAPDGYLTAPLIGPPRRFVPSATADIFVSAEPEDLTNAIRIVRDGDRATRIDTPLMAFERVAWWQQPPVLAVSAAVGIATALGTLVRTRRRLRHNVSRSHLERVAAGVQTLAAVAWLASAAAFGVFAMNALADETTLVYDWPPAMMLVFSSAALLATAVTAMMVVGLPAVWRHDGAWTTARKVRFTATAAIFAVCAAVLGSWGALQPWNP